MVLRFDRDDAPPQQRRDIAVGPECGWADQKPFKRPLARQIFLRQWRPVIGEIRFAAQQRDGAARMVVMELIRAAGIDELRALGGGCSDATGRIVINEAFLNRLPNVSVGEDNLLSGSNHRTPEPRLSRQIPFSPVFDGWRVKTASWD